MLGRIGCVVGAAVNGLTAFSADGHLAEWETWDTAHREAFALIWENEAWTATGRVGRENVQYVLRLAPTWHVRQFLLFRDLDQPDLWLALDAAHRWGEVNGSYRPELDGCVDVELACTPFTPAVPIRRAGLAGLGGLAAGETTEMAVIHVDVETLAVVPRRVRYQRVGQRAWRRSVIDTGGGDGGGNHDSEVRDFTVDDYGLVVEEPGRFRRVR